jgi:hypothetical protein
MVGYGCGLSSSALIRLQVGGVVRPRLVRDSGRRTCELIRGIGCNSGGRLGGRAAMGEKQRSSEQA